MRGRKGKSLGADRNSHCSVELGGRVAASIRHVGPTSPTTAQRRPDGRVWSLWWAGVSDFTWCSATTELLVQYQMESKAI